MTGTVPTGLFQIDLGIQGLPVFPTLPSFLRFPRRHFTPVRAGHLFGVLPFPQGFLLGDFLPQILFVRQPSVLLCFPLRLHHRPFLCFGPVLLVFAHVLLQQPHFVDLLRQALFLVRTNLQGFHLFLRVHHDLGLFFFLPCLLGHFTFQLICFGTVRA